jgi:tetratricopeptide (TPR) repeat protein
MVFSLFKSKDKKKQVDPQIAASLNGERSSNPQVSIKLAEHFLREKKTEQAVDEYMNAAQCFLEKRQTQLAMAVYRNIITIDPERYSVYETLAELYRKSGFTGDGASVLLALAYQYKKTGCDSEVKRVLDSVLEFAPNNPVLKRKVEAFFAAEGTQVPAEQKTSAPAPEGEPTGRIEPVVQKLSDPVPQQKTVAAPEPVEPAKPVQESAITREAAEQKPAAPVAAPEPTGDSLEPAVEPPVSDEPGRPFFNLRSALEEGPHETSAGDVPPDERAQEPQVKEEPSAAHPEPALKESGPATPDETAQSFFDLQSALASDATLGFDYEQTSEEHPNADHEGSMFSVLNIVKDIAVQDPRQDTPQFHFNLGMAYMQCEDYEKAVDEFLSALYGTPDKNAALSCSAGSLPAVF